MTRVTVLLRRPFGGDGPGRKKEAAMSGDDQYGRIGHQRGIVLARLPSSPPSFLPGPPPPKGPQCNTVTRDRPSPPRVTRRSVSRSLLVRSGFANPPRSRLLLRRGSLFPVQRGAPPLGVPKGRRTRSREDPRLGQRGRGMDDPSAPPPAQHGGERQTTGHPQSRSCFVCPARREAQAGL